MNRWKHTLNLCPEWTIEAEKGDDADTKALANLICERIKQSKIPMDDELKLVVDLFHKFSSREIPSIDQFNDFMEIFYNWADDKKVWVKTF